MSILKVLTYPDRILKEVSHPIKKVTNQVRELAANMFDTMYAEEGIGLAAPQIGEGIRLIVLDVGKNRDNEDEDEIPDPIAMINPEVISGAELIQYEERCLSCPELAVMVDRQKNIIVRYLDLEGKPLELSTTGLQSICIQHEIDHLNGVLLVDKVSRLRRDLYKQKRIKILKEEKEMNRM